VADFRDPWVATADRGDWPRWRRAWEACWEKAVLCHADVVVANAPLACARLQQSFPAFARKMISVANGYDPERFAARDSPPRGSGGLTIVHAGNLYGGRDARPFLDALQQLTSAAPHGQTPCRVKFIGRVDEGDTDLHAELRRRGLGAAVEVTGPLPYEAALRHMIDADLLLLLDSPGRHIGVPAKLYEYLGARRPILALAEREGDVALVLHQSGLPYRLAPPADAAAILRALKELGGGIRTGTLAPPDPQALPRFTRAGAARQLAEAMDRCLRGQSPQAPEAGGRDQGTSEFSRR
jgi:glycosyltransferase involved in cell wall biosynthesis